MLHLAGGDDLVLDAHGQIDRDRKRQALVAAGLAVDLRIDADHFTAGVEQRATRITWVDRNVGLNERHAAVRDRTTGGTNHAGSDGALEAIRRTDGQHPLAHQHRFGFADRRHGQALGIDFQHSHVGARVGAQDLGAKLAAILQLDRDFVSALHDVCVGKDDAVRAYDEARSSAENGRFTTTALTTGARVLKLLEKLIQRMARVEAWHAACTAAATGGRLGAANDADIDHCLALLRGDAREVGQRHGRRRCAHGSSRCSARGGRDDSRHAWRGGIGSSVIVIDSDGTDRAADDARGTQGQRQAFGSDGSNGTWVRHGCAPDENSVNR